MGVLIGLRGGGMLKNTVSKGSGGGSLKIFTIKCIGGINESAKQSTRMPKLVFQKF